MLVTDAGRRCLPAERTERPSPEDIGRLSDMRVWVRSQVRKRKESYRCQPRTSRRRWRPFDSLRQPVLHWPTPTVQTVTNDAAKNWFPAVRHAPSRRTDLVRADPFSRPGATFDCIGTRRSTRNRETCLQHGKIDFLIGQQETYNGKKEAVSRT